MLRGRMIVLLTLGALLSAFACASAVPHAGMLRHPDVSSTHIVFRYANDLWLAPREGGTAVRLTSADGAESNPKFSPDGKTVAFRGNYEGNTDIYTIPVEGGIPFRVTHHPSGELLSDWSPDGRILFSAYGASDNPNARQLFIVDADGGLPEKLPIPYGANLVMSQRRGLVAYTPAGNDYATWKRYSGGRASDIWLVDLERGTSRRATDWEGNDSLPMWHNGLLYYVSDAGRNHKMNIWVYDVDTEQHRQLTHHKDYDVKWPSVGPGPGGAGEIVYQLGSELRLLSLDDERSRAVKIDIPGDFRSIRERTVDASENIMYRDVSATGKRAVVSARGDIWTLPAENGVPINLTRSDSTLERDAAWSPDGKWIAYFSDETGEYELWVTQSDGRGDTRRLTNEELGFLYSPVWSPDSKKIAYWDSAKTLHVADVDGGTRTVARMIGPRRSRVSWSHDSAWLAWSDAKTPLGRSCVWLCELEEGTPRRVTAGMFTDTWPTFDRSGDYLFFASERDFSTPTYSVEGATWIYASTDRLFAVPLRDDIESPFLPEIDQEEWSDEDTDSEDDDDDADGEGDDADDEDSDEEEALVIDLEGFESRAMLLPVSAGAFTNLAVNDEGNLLYVRREPWGDSSINLADMSDKDDMEKTVIGGAGDYAMSGDGAKILVTQHGSMAIVEARPDQDASKTISTSGMTAAIDPRSEWAAILRDAWRLERDFFYAPNMHGVDWDGVWDLYSPMVDDCASRGDLSYVIGEMIGELNVGHAYNWGGDTEDSPSVSTGLLGCDYELVDGAYRVSRIYSGAPWDADARGPLKEPGVDVSEGDFVLAVNGVELDTSVDPWAAFAGLAGKAVSLTVSDKPTIDEDAREVVIELMSSDSALRYRDWVERNRAYVEEKSGGRVGYIHVPDTGVNGQNELVRQFNGNFRAEALIVDERWNGGGQVPTRFIELLNRPLANYWSVRNSDVGYPTPEFAHFGPKCMMINGAAGSGGDYFPYWFKRTGLGKLIGTRTWGGLVAMGRPAGLTDGGWTTTPITAFYDVDGTWGIEGHGVDPDIEIVDDPALMLNGEDPQLDAAIALMLEELEDGAVIHAPVPDYPDRTGVGVLEEDR